MASRRIGTVVGGKAHLARSLTEMHKTGWSAAQIRLTHPNKHEMLPLPDVASIRFLGRHEMSLYVRAPYCDVLYPPLVRHLKQVEWMVALGRAAELVGAGLVLGLGRHSAEYLDTHVAAAHALVANIPPSVPVFILNDYPGVPLEKMAAIVAQLRESGCNISLALDTAYAWRARQPYLFEEDPLRLPILVKRISAYVGLIYLANDYLPLDEETIPGNAVDPRPLLHGEIPLATFTRILKAFPEVPVVLDRVNIVQAVVDKSVVIAIDADLHETLAALTEKSV